MSEFTKLVREKHDYIWQKSMNHSFIQQLANGSLSKAVFRYYLLQDNYYLIHFSRIYKFIAESTDDEGLKHFFELESQNFEQGEQAIREQFFKDLNITDNEIRQTKIAPTAYHYVSHIYKNLYTEPIAVTLASLLPCPWLYFEISQKLIHKRSPDKIYQRWIETYSGDEMANNIKQFRDIIDRYAKSATSSELQKMDDSFMISSQLELNFWQMAMTQENWK